MTRPATSPESEKLERWLAAVADRLALKVDDTITLATVAAVTKVADPLPASLARLPALDLSDDDAELRVVRSIGRGGMGHVQLARQRALGRDVALKRVPPEGGHPLAASALLQEARVTGRLEHPNIVPVHMLGCDADGLPVIVMKRVEGVRWRDLIGDDAPSSWHTTRVWSHDPTMRHLEILLEVCNAVHFAHSLGVVHRDIKPSNVMVGTFGEVYLLDWGIATAMDTPAFAHASGDETTLPLGTPAFMAPEQVALQGVIDQRTDVYQLGASLHLALCHTPRHKRADDDLVPVLASVLESAPYDYPPEVPAELGAICNKAMARSPGDRYASVLELRDALTHFMRHRAGLRLELEAHKRLMSLEEAIAAFGAGGDDKLSAIHKLFTECRFAFMQALLEWDENPGAQRGVARCVEMMARFELARGNLAAAEVLLDELPAVPPSLTGELQAARRSADEERAHLRDLQQMRADLDIGVDRHPRSVMSATLAVAVTALGLLFLPIGRAALLQRSNWTILVAFGAFGAIFAGVLLFGRGHLMRTTASRRVAATVAVGLAGMMGTRLVAALSGLDMRFAASIDLWVCAAVGGLAAATIERGVAVMAAVYVVGAAVVLALPEGRPTTITFVLTQTLAFAVGGVFWIVRGGPDSR